MEPSTRVTGLYSDMYADGVERDWRDASAVDKCRNIVQLWQGAHLPPAPRVVELGCGEGAIAADLAAQGFFSTYHGYDLSRSGVAEAESRAVPGATFRIVTGEGVPAEDDSADLVVLSHVVEHLEHPRTLLYEAMRIAPYVVVEVPLELTARIPHDYVWSDLGHINHYTATSIRQLLQTCDLEVLDQFTSNPPSALFGSPLLRKRLNWQIKQLALRAAPSLGRTLFVYHETLLARRRDVG